ncbi:hypothetical protein P4O66_002337 [Electrophorus voltai]|uniref:Uncharacterized protein n=1 Tax=Electrophorus voltai TaxID=2609070 RepID=A0AAD9DRG4_9TELE|nr:hypothetical protein P4O66_002337 [Electrophorus voltai]
MWDFTSRDVLWRAPASRPPSSQRISAKKIPEEKITITKEADVVSAHIGIPARSIDLHCLWAGDRLHYRRNTRLYVLRSVCVYQAHEYVAECVCSRLLYVLRSCMCCGVCVFQAAVCVAKLYVLQSVCMFQAGDHHEIGSVVMPGWSREKRGDRERVGEKETAKGRGGGERDEKEREEKERDEKEREEKERDEKEREEKERDEKEREEKEREEVYAGQTVMRLCVRRMTVIIGVETARACTRLKERCGWWMRPARTKPPSGPLTKTPERKELQPPRALQPPWWSEKPQKNFSLHIQSVVRPVCQCTPLIEGNCWEEARATQPSLCSPAPDGQTPRGPPHPWGEGRHRSRFPLAQAPCSVSRSPWVYRVHVENTCVYQDTSLQPEGIAVPSITFSFARFYGDPAQQVIALSKLNKAPFTTERVNEAVRAQTAVNRSIPLAVSRTHADRNSRRVKVTHSQEQRLGSAPDGGGGGEMEGKTERGQSRKERESESYTGHSGRRKTKPQRRPGAGIRVLQEFAVDYPWTAADRSGTLAGTHAMPTLMGVQRQIAHSPQHPDTRPHRGRAGSALPSSAGLANASQAGCVSQGDALCLSCLPNDGWTCVVPCVHNTSKVCIPADPHTQIFTIISKNRPGQSKGSAVFLNPPVLRRKEQGRLDGSQEKQKKGGQFMTWSGMQALLPRMPQRNPTPSQNCTSIKRQEQFSTEDSAGSHPARVLARDRERRKSSAYVGSRYLRLQGYRGREAPGSQQRELRQFTTARSMMNKAIKLSEKELTKSDREGASDPGQAELEVGHANDPVMVQCVCDSTWSHPPGELVPTQMAPVSTGLRRGEERRGEEKKRGEERKRGVERRGKKRSGEDRKRGEERSTRLMQSRTMKG